MARNTTKKKARDNQTGIFNNWTPRRERIVLIAVLIFTFLMFYPSVRYDYVNWDDDVNVTINPNVQQLNKESVRNMFTSTVIGGYTPLTTLTFALEVNQWGFNPKVHHLNNIILHILCTLLVFILLKSLGINSFMVVVATFLFAVHPMRVESVAWITERKDVLYGFFFLLSAILYIRFTGTGKYLYYILALLTFILALLSKIQAVSLPLALLAIDFFREGKFTFRQVLNKVPFFILSLATGLAGIHFLSQEGSLETGTIMPIWERIFIGTYSLLVYLVKSVIPYGLSAIYPFPARLTWMHYVSLPVVLAMIFGIYKIGKFRKEVWFGFLFFFVNVVFMLQIIGAGQGYLADRFTYIGYIGLFFLVALAIRQLALSKLNYFLLPLAGFYLGVLTVQTSQRLRVWENTETLFTDVIEKYPRVAVAHNNMGRYFREQNQYDKAIASYNEALEIDPDGYNTLNNRGKAFFDTGRTEEALADFNRSVDLNGEYAESRSNRGAALASKGEFEAALTDLDKAVELEPGNLSARSNRALVLYTLNRYDKAIEEITRYLNYKPDDADMMNLRSLAFNQMNRNSDALNDLNRAIAINPSQGVFWQNRSFLHNKTGNYAAALQDIQKAVELGIKVNPAYITELQGRVNSGR